MKVENDAIWQKFVKEGNVKGFSIEGYFEQVRFKPGDSKGREAF